MLVVPSVPRVPTVAEVLAEPIAVNSMLGTYTNFVNLLDLCAADDPGRHRRTADGPPASVTLIAPGLARRRARQPGVARSVRPPAAVRA